MRFRFDPLSRAFLDRCVFGETAQRISVDGRPERFVRWCGRGLVSVMIYYHNHSCKSGHEPSFTAKLKMITTTNTTQISNFHTPGQDRDYALI